jgi:hypothetical protein
MQRTRRVVPWNVFPSKYEGEWDPKVVPLRWRLYSNSGLDEVCGGVKAVSVSRLVKLSNVDCR